MITLIFIGLLIFTTQEEITIKRWAADTVQVLPKNNIKVDSGRNSNFKFYVSFQLSVQVLFWKILLHQYLGYLARKWVILKTTEITGYGMKTRYTLLTVKKKLGRKQTTVAENTNQRYMCSSVVPARTSAVIAGPNEFIAICSSDFLFSCGSFARNLVLALGFNL